MPRKRRDWQAELEAVREAGRRAGARELWDHGISWERAVRLNLALGKQIVQPVPPHMLGLPPDAEGEPSTDDAPREPEVR